MNHCSFTEINKLGCHPNLEKNFTLGRPPTPSRSILESKLILWYAANVKIQFQKGKEMLEHAIKAICHRTGYYSHGRDPPSDIHFDCYFSPILWLNAKVKGKVIKVNRMWLKFKEKISKKYKFICGEKAFCFWFLPWLQFSINMLNFEICSAYFLPMETLTGITSVAFLDDLLSSLVCCYHLASIAFWFSLWPLSLGFLAAQWLTWRLFPSLTPVKSSG